MLQNHLRVPADIEKTKAQNAASHAVVYIANIIFFLPLSYTLHSPEQTK
jgi:hypothetical protein